MSRSSVVAAVGVVVAAGVALSGQRAEACGCFAPPDPTVPIVQAGERILFAVDNGVVTAHIQIQYSGDARDFGWLLPLPSVPTLTLGTEELFTQLVAATQPRYFVQQVNNGRCGSVVFGLASPASAGGFADAGGPGPLVTQSSVGPYDYAVLRADSKTEMFDWLRSNGYFIPTGTDESVGPYIFQGGYFLALKLKSGLSAGDIQPVVLKYTSQLPMIPIILTSVAATPNMGVLVWTLGHGRGIPRNYNHVVINDAQVDWLNQAANYNDVIIRAVSETPEKHAFVTEYSGTSAIMRGVLDRAGRFGLVSELAAQTDPDQFVSYLFANGYTAAGSSNGFGAPFASTLLQPVRDLLLRGIPYPEGMRGFISEDEFLGNLGYYLTQGYRDEHPSFFAGWQLTFDAPALAAQLEERVVKPTREAGALFGKYPTLTRLYTTLSPQDMTRDPVFSFNPSLPDVSRDHTATLTLECGLLAGDPSAAAATLKTEQGWVFHLDNQNAVRELNVGPAALRIESLREDGAPEVLTDNTGAIRDEVGCGCAAVDPLAALGALAALGLLRRRRVQA